MSPEFRKAFNRAMRLKRDVLRRECNHMGTMWDSQTKEFFASKVAMKMLGAERQTQKEAR